MKEKLFDILDKIYVKKDSGEMSGKSFSFRDIDDRLKAVFVADFLLAFGILIVTLIITIWRLNLYILVLGLFIVAYKIFITSSQIQKCLDDKVKVVVGTVKKLDNQDDEEKKVKSKNVVDIVTEDGYRFRIPVTKAFEAEEGNIITAFIPVDKCYQQSEKFIVATECYNISVE